MVEKFDNFEVNIHSEPWIFGKLIQGIYKVAVAQRANTIQTVHFAWKLKIAIDLAQKTTGKS